MNEYRGKIRRILGMVWREREKISDKEVLRQMAILKVKITERCRERLLEVVHGIRDGDIKNVTEAEEELEKEPCC